MPRSAPERAAQVAIVEYLKLVLPEGAMVWAVVNEAAPKSKTSYGRARFFAKRKAAGVLTGFPDLGVSLAGRTLFIETKRPVGGVVSSEQQERHRELRILGHAVGVCVDIESARAFLQDEGVILREARGQHARHAVVRMAARKGLVNDALPF